MVELQFIVSSLFETNWEGYNGIIGKCETLKLVILIIFSKLDLSSNFDLIK